MKGRDEIQELFSEKLGNYEAKVDPSLWTNIASQIGGAATTAVVSTGLSIFSKWVIALSVASAVVLTTIVVLNNTNESVTEKSNKTEQVAENNELLEESDQVLVDDSKEKVVVIEHKPQQKESRVIKKQNWDNASLEGKNPEKISAKEPLETEGVTNTDQERSLVEVNTKVKVEDKEAVIDPIIKEADPIEFVIVLTLRIMTATTFALYSC